MDRMGKGSCSLGESQRLGLLLHWSKSQKGSCSCEVHKGQWNLWLITTPLWCGLDDNCSSEVTFKCAFTYHTSFQILIWWRGQVLTKIHLIYESETLNALLNPHNRPCSTEKIINTEIKCWIKTPIPSKSKIPLLQPHKKIDSVHVCRWRGRSLPL